MSQSSSTYGKNGGGAKPLPAPAPAPAPHTPLPALTKRKYTLDCASFWKLLPPPFPITGHTLIRDSSRPMRMIQAARLTLNDSARATLHCLMCLSYPFTPAHAAAKQMNQILMLPHFLSISVCDLYLLLRPWFSLFYEIGRPRMHVDLHLISLNPV